LRGSSAKSYTSDLAALVSDGPFGSELARPTVKILSSGLIKRDCFARIKRSSPVM
jgi:hypothetical protein